MKKEFRKDLVCTEARQEQTEGLSLWKEFKDDDDYDDHHDVQEESFAPPKSLLLLF